MFDRVRGPTASVRRWCGDWPRSSASARRGHLDLTVCVVEQNYCTPRMYERLGAIQTSSAPAPWAAQHVPRSATGGLTWPHFALPSARSLSAPCSTRQRTLAAKTPMIAERSPRCSDRYSIARRASRPRLDVLRRDRSAQGGRREGLCKSRASRPHLPCTSGRILIPKYRTTETRSCMPASPTKPASSKTPAPAGPPAAIMPRNRWARHVLRPSARNARS